MKDQTDNPITGKPKAKAPPKVSAKAKTEAPKPRVEPVVEKTLATGGSGPSDKTEGTTGPAIKAVVKGMVMVDRKGIATLAHRYIQGLTGSTSAMSRMLEIGRLFDANTLEEAKAKYAELREAS